MDLRNKVVGFAYSSKARDAGMTGEFLEAIKDIHLEKLERWREVNLSKGIGPLLVGNSATAPDFSLW